MISKDEALKMAIYLLDNEVDDPRCSDSIDKTIQACKEALEQPTQEPVGYVHEDQYGYGASLKVGLKHGTKLYTHSKKWQGLSEEEIDTLGWVDYPMIEDCIEIYKEIEQKLKEKNHG